MEAHTLTAEAREGRRKGPARRLRRQGRIPAVFYGAGQASTAISLDPREVHQALESAHGRNQLLEIEVDGEKRLALFKELQVHPVSRALLHADLYLVARDRTVQTSVPFEVDGRAVGVQKGGTLRKLFRTLPVEAYPQNVPAAIQLDVSNLDLGAVVTVADLALPEGVEVTYAPSRRVLFIESKERGKTDEEDGEDEKK